MKVIISNKCKKALLKEAGPLDTLKNYWNKAVDLKDQFMVGRELARRETKPEKWREKYESLISNPEYSNVPQIEGYNYIPGMQQALYRGTHTNISGHRNPFIKERSKQTSGKWKVSPAARNVPNMMSTINSVISSMSLSDSLITQEVLDTARELQNKGFIEWVPEKENNTNDQQKQNPQTTPQQNNAVGNVSAVGNQKTT